MGHGGDPGRGGGAELSVADVTPSSLPSRGADAGAQAAQGHGLLASTHLIAPFL